MEKPRHFQRFIVIFATFFFSSKVMAIGGAESMDRPSARDLPRLDIPSTEKQSDFVLPEIPHESADFYLADSRIFHFSKIVIEGNTVLPHSTLSETIKNYVHRNINVAEIEELRQRLTQLYVNAGYINSGAVISENAVKNGILRINIVEGRLAEINIKGLGRLREGYIKNRLQDDPDVPLNLNELQDRFQVLLSDPLISRMNGKLLPGLSPGQSILEVEVTRAQPYHLTLFGDNYRPPSIGGEAFGLSGQVYNVTGLGDAFDFTYITSAGSNRYAGGFHIPVNDWGTVAFFHFDEGDSKVIEGSVKRLNIRSEVHNLEGGVSHLIINQFNRQLNIGLLLAIRENETTLDGSPYSFVPGEPTGRNQASVWRFFQFYMQRWERQAFAIRSTFSVGMNALGSTPKTNARFPSSEFFAWLGQAQYAYRISNDGAQLVLRSNVQISDSPVLPLERISIGGRGTVRGYRENHLVTDNGFSISAEYHWPIFGATNAKQRLTLIPFLDYGAAWNHVEDSSSIQHHLLSIGLGINWQYKPVSVDLFYGHALFQARPNTEDDLQDEAVHFQIRVDAL